MSYIKSVRPMDNHCLFVEMEGGSTAAVDFSCKLHTIKFAELADEALFQTAVTDGDYVVWGGGRLRITAGELMDVILLG
ncbi:MAG: DUF2442 domain-containing protein [Clostridia bacterium]|nr:DUF2442 domain-containing protein [Clostridia bacterium]